MKYLTYRVTADVVQNREPDDHSGSNRRYFTVYLLCFVYFDSDLINNETFTTVSRKFSWWISAATYSPDRGSTVGFMKWNSLFCNRPVSDGTLLSWNEPQTWQYRRLPSCPTMHCRSPRSRQARRPRRCRVWELCLKTNIQKHVFGFSVTTKPLHVSTSRKTE